MNRYVSRPNEGDKHLDVLSKYVCLFVCSKIRALGYVISVYSQLVVRPVIEREKRERMLKLLLSHVYLPSS